MSVLINHLHVLVFGGWVGTVSSDIDDHKASKNRDDYSKCFPAR